jgi:hypothetical protein
MAALLQIIETPDYILAVSDEEIKVNDYCIMLDSFGNLFSNVQQYTNPETQHLNKGLRKVIAYQPKGNAPELNLPLLPEIVVEDDVEKLAEKLNIIYVLLKRRGLFDTGVEELLKIENLLIQARIEANEKAATKKYNEDDLRKAIKMAWEADSIDGTVDLNIVLHYGNNNDLRTKWTEDEIIQSLKTHTPKWFVAETVCDQCLDDKTTDSCYCHFGNYKTVLKTTTIEGKVYLVGTYLYE